MTHRADSLTPPPRLPEPPPTQIPEIMHNMRMGSFSTPKPKAKTPTKQPEASPSVTKQPEASPSVLPAAADAPPPVHAAPAPAPPPAVEDKEDAAEAAKAAAKAAKEARKAAHLASMASQGQTGDKKEEKPKMSKAERRAQQEAQRAAKAAKAGAAADGGSEGKENAGKEGKEDAAGAGPGLGVVDGGGGKGDPMPSARQLQKNERRSTAATAAKAKSRPSGKIMDHFSHLRQFASDDDGNAAGGGGSDHKIRVAMLATAAGGIHPAVARLAAHYADGTITGGRARCVALLHTLKLVIADFKTPKNTKYAHALTSLVNGVVQHLQAARPMAVSMGNAVKSLKTHLARMAEDASLATEEEARARTLKHLEYFEKEKLFDAGAFIAEHGANEIVDGDVVVTHGASHHVREILLRAKRDGRAFAVTVVDSRPNLEGRDTLRRLLGAGVDCTYATLAGLSYVLREGGATKVFLGAAAVLANGAVVSRVGTAAVAAVANAHGVPVLVAAETCKFHERVHLDAVAYNELGNPAAIASTVTYPAAYGHGGRNPSLGRWVGRSGEGAGFGPGGFGGVEAAGGFGSRGDGLEGWEKVERLSVLNLTYDVTPAECVTSVVCESGLVAPSDVPSFLR